MGGSMSKREIVTIATQILNGEIDPLEGCRRIVRQQGTLSEAERRDPDFATLVGIESETDAFPSSEARQHWDARALAELDRERAVYVERNRKWLVDACRAIVSKSSED